MERFLRSIDMISEYSGRIISYLIIPLILTIVYSVVMRYYFKEIAHWAFEMSLFMYGIMVTVGGAYALKHKAHVRVDMLNQYVGPKWSAILDLISFLVIVIVCIVIVYLGWKAAWISTLKLERSPLQTPFNPQIWWFKWFIPFSAALVGLQAVVETIRTARSIASGDLEKA